MHDPNTVAFEIRAPWFRRDKHFRSGRYHSSLVTVWHVDPEADGSDDSCDWFGRKLPAEAKALAKEMAAWEEKFPYLFAQPVRLFKRSDEDGEYTIRRIGPGDCMAVVLAVFIQAAWRLRKHSVLTAKDMAAAMYVSVNEADNFQMALASRDPRDREATIGRIIGCYLKTYRRWWRHPRWHVHHWRVQVHAIQSLKRRLFTRCEHCGKGFGWGQAVHTSSWHGTGPRWFRSEPNVHHAGCSPHATNARNRPSDARSPLP